MLPKACTPPHHTHHNGTFLKDDFELYLPAVPAAATTTARQRRSCLVGKITVKGAHREPLLPGPLLNKVLTGSDPLALAETAEGTQLCIVSSPRDHEAG